MDFAEGVGESSSPPRSFGSFSNYDVRNDVFNRLVENGHGAAVTNPEFREQLDAHFNRLPASYGLDVNIDRVEDVLLHQKLLALAKDPEKRPVYHIRFLENISRTDVNGNQDLPSILTTPGQSINGANIEALSHKRTRNHTSDFEPCSKLEDLNLDVGEKNSKDTEEQCAKKMLSRRR